MTIELTKEKKEKIVNHYEEALSNRVISIRQLAKVIGNLVAAFPAVPNGKLYYRELEREKIYALRSNRGDFDKKFPISDKACQDLIWWKDNIISSIENIRKPEIDITIHTDASLIGWGITNGHSSNGGIKPDWK